MAHQPTSLASLSTPEKPTSEAPLRALAGWVLFDFAAQPYYTLILTFLFAPYFATVVASDPVRGQTLWGYAAAVASILVAAGSPLIGALADRHGARKPWIAGLSLVFITSLGLLWLAAPAAPMAVLLVVLLAFIAATVAVEFATVLTNSLMPELVSPARYGRLSGIGWGVGYLGGLISLAVMAGLIVTNPATGRTLFGFEPLLALDQTAREADRLVGPFAAVWFAVFMMPFFLFVPVSRTRRANASEPKSAAFHELWQTVRALPSSHDMLLFLVARMIYQDGLAAVFAFGGIYGAAIFGWGALELGLFGIILTATGMIGAIIGGVLDDRVGSKTVIVFSLVILLIGALGIVSVDRSHILFVVDVAPKAETTALLGSTGERMFLAFAMLVGLVAAPVQAASRSLLARLAPVDKITQYFGLFAFSGRVTAFLAPLLVASVTAMTGDQRLGIASIAVFLIAGLALMLPVREPQR